MKVSGIVAAGLLAASLALAQAVQADKSALLKIDEQFSADAQRLGVAEAFARYAAPDARMLPAGKDVVSGLDAVKSQMAGFPKGATLA